MTAQGSAYRRFKRALATGNVMIAFAAASELPRIDLADALALTLLLVDVDRSRYERALVRWHARLCRETNKVTAPESQFVLASLQGLGTGLESAAVAALADVLAHYGLPHAVEALERWANSRG